MFFKLVLSLLLASASLQVLQFASATSPHTTTRIVVNGSSANCTNYTSSLLLPREPYCELIDALRYARESGNNTEIFLSHGIHILEHSIEAFKFLTNFVLNGANDSTSFSKIMCVNKTGLNFVESGPITLKNIEFENCGAMHQVNDSNTSGAIILERCWDVSIFNLHINSSQGSGLVLFKPYKSIVIKNCCFNNNVALSGGGGLKVLLSNNTSLYILSCNFTNNQAMSGEGGGAVFIHANDDVSNNNVLVEGGAVLVRLSSKNVLINNTIKLKGNCFTCNKAKYGGGLAIEVAQSNNSVVLSDSCFKGNKANFGSAIYIHSQNGDTNNSPNITIENSKFLNNWHIVSRGKGAVYISNQPTYMKGHLIFRKNQGTALSIMRTRVNIAESSELFFVGNKGYRGGAIAILEGATLMLNNNVSMKFTNNHASQQGGAIYISDIFWDSLNCPIIKFYRNSYETQIVLHNNTAGTKNNSLYIPSVKMCRSKFFNWLCSHKGVQYCSQVVETAPRTINITNDNWTMSVFPGQFQSFPINLYDDYNNDVTNSSFMMMKSNDNSIVPFNAIEKRPFFGKEGSNQTYTISTVEPRIVTRKITVIFKSCPPGYYSSNSSCLCANSFIDKRRLSCNENDNRELPYNAKLYWSWCMTRFNNTDVLVAGDCWPFIEPKHNGQFFVLPKDPSKLERYFCGHLNRKSTLCTECMNDYGLKVLSYSKSCIECNSSDLYLNVFKYIAAQYIPLTAFLLIVVLFKISINNGYANMFVAFAQTLSYDLVIIQMNFLISHNPNKFLDSIWKYVVVHFYGIWNLNFFENAFPHFCISPQFKMVHILALNYIVALYPLFLLVITLVIIQLYERNCKIVTIMWRPFGRCLARFHRKWDIQNSVVDALATFFILSYSKVCWVSLKLLTWNTLQSTELHITHNKVLFIDPSIDYLSGEHIPYFTTALVFLTFYTILPPLLLVLYPISKFQHCLDRVHLQGGLVEAFFHSFHNSYKDGIIGKRDCRYFASFYFMLRIAALIISLFDGYLYVDMLVIMIMISILIIIIVRPYKRMVFNVIDCFILTTSGVLVVLGNYIFEQPFPGQASGSTLVLKIFLLLASLLPLIYIVSLVFYKTCSKFSCFARLLKILKSHRSALISSYPHRLMHPSEYN